ncbi:MAG: hypothetical protein OXL38_16740 [Gammaproteobacteria bacterium]|nr:hypothetical protein [Gammaproteobacteria bacterium]
MTRLPPAALGCFDPVPAALEGIARQRDATPLLAGEQSREVQRHAGLIGTSNGRRERALDIGERLVARRSL